MRRELVSVAVGATFCLMFGLTRGLGFGLPPYSFIYAVAVGLIVGIGAFGILSIKWRGAPLLFGIAVIGLLAASTAITLANERRASAGSLMQSPAVAPKPTLGRAPIKPRVGEP